LSSYDTSILLNSLESGHILVDRELNVYFQNRWLSTNTQIKDSEIVGKNLLDFYPNINKSTLQRKIDTAFLLDTPTFYSGDSKEPFLKIKRNKVSSMSLEYMQLQVTITPYDRDSKIVMISIYDISDVFETKLSLDKEIEKVNALNQTLELQKDVMDKNIMILRTSIDGSISEASSMFCEFYGYTKDELVGQNISIISSKKLPSSIYKEMWSFILSGKSWSGEVENITKNGTLKWVQLSINPVIDSSGNLVEFNAFYHDITSKKLLEELYIRDTLTGLYNRAYFEKYIASIKKSQRKTDTPFALIIADIDHFKSINDTFGHQVGDEALKGVASTLNLLLRSDDIIARWGGEEFVIMLKDIDLENAIKIANKLRIAVEEKEIIKDRKITCSFGVSLYNLDDDIDEVFKKADEALYKAKNSGRNRVLAVQ
jgi:diguanylate cyclase (GGDEF)-like protein/PAS domain S-box-containing protein